MSRYISPDVIEQCRKVNIYQIISEKFSGDWNKEGRYLRHKVIDSLIISRNGYWMRNSDGDAGNNPIDFFCKYYDMGFLEAVETVAMFLNVDFDTASKQYPQAHVSRKPPEQAPKPWNRTINYMKSRSIPEGLTQKLFQSGMLYESLFKGYRNVCFIDPASGHFECTGMNWVDKSKRFKQVSDGASYWAFCPKGNKSTAIVCESAIDSISCFLLFGIDATYISLCGCASRKNLLERIMKEFPEVILAVDSDDAGNALAKSYQEVQRLCPPKPFKDWNDMLRSKNRQAG